jgi:hypothetical protein
MRALRDCIVGLFKVYEKDFFVFGSKTVLCFSAVHFFCLKKTYARITRIRIQLNARIRVRNPSTTLEPVMYKTCDKCAVCTGHVLLISHLRKPNTLSPPYFLLPPCRGREINKLHLATSNCWPYNRVCVWLRIYVRGGTIDLAAGTICG